MPALHPLRTLRDLRHAGLLRRAKAGDRGAFVRLYRGLYGPVAAYVGRRVASRADAEEIVARTFHLLLESLDDLDPSRGPVVAWALQVARHALKDRARAARRDGPLDGAAELAADAPDALAAVLRAEELARLRAALDAAPEEVKEIVALRFADGLPHREIATVLGLSEAAVRKRLSRALHDLRAAALPEEEA